MAVLNPIVPWVPPRDVPHATEIQRELQELPDPVGDPDPEQVRWIAGVDASITRDKERMIGAICLFRWPELELVDCQVRMKPVAFPYVPGYLSFREIPVLIEAARALSQTPDLVLVDGQGRLHPRRLGLASHLALVTGWTTIGCAKSRLIGEHESPGPVKGDWDWITVDGERVGTIVRTRDMVKPVWVSPGHGVSPDSAREWVMRTVTRYRLPEPVRASHNAASAARRADQSGG